MRQCRKQVQNMSETTTRLESQPHAAGDFYSRGAQFRRVLAWHTRKHAGLVCGGAFLTLAAFYWSRDLGANQTYHVLAPYVLAVAVIAILTFRVMAPAMADQTRLYYFSLPMNRMTAWDARMLWLGSVTVLLEVLILVGAALKLGGGGITPDYRIAVDFAVLPILSLALMAMGASAVDSADTWSANVGGLFPQKGAGFTPFLVVIGAACWLIVSVEFWPEGGFPANLAALCMLCMALILAVGTRIRWAETEVGENA
jgi:hypothetical protein